MPTKEGYKFRGRGYIQLTGKDNYTAFGKAINEDVLSNPDLVSSKYALLSAAWFFNKNGLHKIADEGSTDTVVTKITKRVNGGTIGLADRIKHFKIQNKYEAISHGEKVKWLYLKQNPWNLEAACNRGAFKAAEMSTVGGLYDKLSKFLDHSQAQLQAQQAQGDQNA